MVVRRIFVALCFLMVFPTPARAHGDLDGAIPEPGATVSKPPNHMVINFTEPPTKDAVFKVKDGCGRDLISETEVEGKVGHLYLENGGRPGRWKISYRILSAADGHATKGSYRVTVKGKKDCSAPEEPRDEGDERSEPKGTGAAAPPGGDDEEGSFPAVPVALGTVAVAGLAFLIRRIST